MKPFKVLFLFSTWLMRLSVLFFIIMRYWETLAFFNYKSIMFYVAALFIVFASLLFIGGFLKKERLTLISSLILILVTGYHAFLNLESGIDHNFAIFVMIGAICFYFLSSGNKR